MSIIEHTCDQCGQRAWWLNVPPRQFCRCGGHLSDWIDDAAEAIASSPDCCDISSASATAIAEVIRRHAERHPQLDGCDCDTYDRDPAAHASDCSAITRQATRAICTGCGQLTAGLNYNPCVTCRLRKAAARLRADRSAGKEQP